jgi:hypothetical protein
VEVEEVGVVSGEGSMDQLREVYERALRDYGSSHVGKNILSCSPMYGGVWPDQKPESEASRVGRVWPDQVGGATVLMITGSHVGSKYCHLFIQISFDRTFCPSKKNHNIRNRSCLLPSDLSSEKVATSLLPAFSDPAHMRS